MPTPHTVACSQDAFKHFLFDLTRTSDIHPVVVKMEIVGDQKEGIGKNVASSFNVIAKNDLLLQ